jgi:hypothetical protein
MTRRVLLDSQWPWHFALRVSLRALEDNQMTDVANLLGACPYVDWNDARVSDLRESLDILDSWHLRRPHPRCRLPSGKTIRTFPATFPGPPQAAFLSDAGRFSRPALGLLIGMGDDKTLLSWLTGRVTVVAERESGRKGRWRPSLRARVPDVAEDVPTGLGFLPVPTKVVLNTRYDQGELEGLRTAFVACNSRMNARLKAKLREEKDKMTAAGKSSAVRSRGVRLQLDEGTALGTTMGTALGTTMGTALGTTMGTALGTELALDSKYRVNCWGQSLMVERRGGKVSNGYGLVDAWRVVAWVDPQGTWVCTRLDDSPQSRERRACVSSVMGLLCRLQERGAEVLREVSVLMRHCALCGNRLTRDASISRGVGDKCAALLFGEDGKLLLLDTPVVAASRQLGLRRGRAAAPTAAGIRELAPRSELLTGLLELLCQEEEGEVDEGDAERLHAHLLQLVKSIGGSPELLASDAAAGLRRLITMNGCRPPQSPGYGHGETHCVPDAWVFTEDGMPCREMLATLWLSEALGTLTAELEAWVRGYFQCHLPSPHEPERPSGSAWKRSQKRRKTTLADKQGNCSHWVHECPQCTNVA